MKVTLLWILIQFIQSVEFPLRFIEDDQGRKSEITGINDEFLRTHNMESYVTDQNSNAVEPDELLLDYKKQCRQKGFDKESMKQIESIKYDKAFVDYLRFKDDNIAPEEYQKQSKKTDKDQKLIEDLDKNEEHTTEIKYIDDPILPMDLFSHRKIENGTIQNISNSELPINKYIEQFVEKKYKKQIDNMMRLVEYEPKVDKVDFPPFMKARIVDYWSSSQFMGRYKRYSCYWYRRCRWWRFFCNNYRRCYPYFVYVNYPATNVRYNMLWMSSNVKKKTDIVVFKVSLDRIYRLAYIFISWLKEGASVSVQISVDDEKYFEHVSFMKVSQRTQWIMFDNPQWARYIKLIMKENPGPTFGIYRFDCWTKNYRIMLRSKMGGKQGDCLTVADGNYESGEIQLMDCIEAINQQDGRELWQMLVTQQIQNVKSMKCINNEGGQQIKNNPIVIGECLANGMNSWMIDHNEKIQLRDNVQWCLTVVSGGRFDNMAFNAKTNSTSQSADNNHPSSMAVDGALQTYWQSEFNNVNEQLIVNLGTIRTIKYIKIVWKYPASEFEVYVLQQYGLWELVLKKKKNSEDTIEIDIAPSGLLGLKIMMNGFNKDKGKIENDFVYGIQEIVMNSDTMGVTLQNCKEYDDLQSNQFLIEEFYYFNSQDNKEYLGERKKLSMEGKVLSRFLQDLIPLPAILTKMLAMAKSIKARNKKMQDELDEKDSAITEYRETFEKDYEGFRQKYLSGQQRAISGQLGTSSGFPAESCAQIRKQFSHKISGFYWIKGECSSSVLRVFCDYSIHKGTFYGFLGPLKDGEILVNANNIKQIQYKCAQLGLEPVQIEKRSQIETIKKYIQNMGIVLKDTMIPIGYDYACDIEKCTGRYQSMKDASTKDITQLLKGYIDSQNIKNQGFAMKGRIDIIGFNMDKGLMSYAGLRNKPIKGIICSDNAFDNTAGLIEVKCNDTVRNNVRLQAELNSNIMVVCPKECADKEQYKVWGSLLYKDDSSVCRAAVHAGQLDDQKGGIVYVGIEKGQMGFQGSTKNKVTSLNYDKMWSRSYVINAYVKECPISKFKHYKPKSFIQIQQKYDSQNVSSMVVRSNKTMISGDLQHLARIDDIRFRRNVQINHLKMMIEQQKKMQLINEKINEIVRRHPRLQDSFIEMDEELMGWKKDEKKGEGGDKKDGGDDDKDADGDDDKDKEKKKEKKEGFSLSTEDAIKQLNDLFSFNQKNVKQFLKMVASSKELILEVSKLTNPMVISDLSAKELSKMIKVNAQHIIGTSSVFKQMQKDADARMKETYRTLQLKKLRVMELQEWLPYIEKYEFLVTDVFDLLDNPQASKGPSKWDITGANLKGHDKAIYQSTEINCTPDESCYASMIVLRIQRFYDFTVKTSVMMSGDGVVGIIFRCEDVANYYVFEMKNLGYKRVRRVFKGQSKIIVQKDDGGYQQDKWYRVVIQSEQSKFKIQMIEESKAGSDEDIPVVLAFEDQYLVYGRAGFSVNNNNGLYIDKFEFHPKDCITELMMKYAKNGVIDYNLKKEDPSQIIFYQGPYCSRYYENYKMKLDLKWREMNHITLSKQPSWKIKKNYQKRDKVIIQEIKAYSPHPDQPGPILYLDYGRYCKDGVVTTDFFAEDDGTVGIVFRFKNKFNYYVLEISGELKKFVRIRKNILGTYYEIAKNEEMGFLKKKWYQVQIFMSGAKMRIYLNENGKEPEMPFEADVSDDEIDEGSIGLSNFMTKVAYDNIRMYPQTDIIKPKEDAMGEAPPTEPLEGEDTKQQKPMTQKPKKKFKNDNGDLKIKWDKCLANKDQKSRFKYCKDVFGFDPNAYEFCAKDYCGSCCDQEIDNLHKVQRFTCKKECNANSKKSDDEKPYKICLDSPKPQKSVFNYCKMNFLQYKEEMQCNQGFCDLCCLTIIKSNNLELDDKTVMDCHTDCFLKYYVPETKTEVEIDKDAPVVKQIEKVLNKEEDKG